MKYQDAIGADIEVGNNIVYSTASGALQIGKVLECTTVNIKDYKKVLVKSKEQTCVQARCYSTVDKSVKCYNKDSHYTDTKYGTTPIPALKIQGARREWKGAGKFEKMKPSFITKFENVLVINSNLAVTMTLI